MVKRGSKSGSKSGQKVVKKGSKTVFLGSPRGPSHVPLYMVFDMFFWNVLKVDRLLGSLDFQDLTFLSFLGPPFLGCPKKDQNGTFGSEGVGFR